MKPNRRRRVVITGIGVVSPLGMGLTENWDSINRGRIGVQYLDGEEGKRLNLKAGQIKGFDIRQYLSSRSEIRLMTRESQFAVVAAKMCVSDGGMDLSAQDSNDMALNLAIELEDRISMPI